jgi:hypothetical protein
MSLGNCGAVAWIDYAEAGGGSSETEATASASGPYWLTCTTVAGTFRGGI